MERLHFKDASNGDMIIVYPNNEEPQETYPFTYKIEGSKLTISDSDGDYVFEELNIQAQTLTLGIYEEGSATTTDRLLIYLNYKRIWFYYRNTVPSNLQKRVQFYSTLFFYLYSVKPCH